MINVAIVEDNKTIREGLSSLIDRTDGFSCVGTYGDCETFLNGLDFTKVNVVLMDIGLPGINGIEGVKRAKQIDPDLNILMLTVYDDNEVVFEALCAGAHGYLVKKTPPGKLIDAIRDIYAGGSPMSSSIARKVINAFQQNRRTSSEETQFELSNREKEVLNQLAIGSNYNEIAENLFISVDTVRHHIRNVYKKLHVHSQSEAVAKAIRKGLI